MGYLAGRFTYSTRSSGETLVPEAALPFLATEGVSFHVEGHAKYEHSVPQGVTAEPRSDQPKPDAKDEDVIDAESEVKE